MTTDNTASDETTAGMNDLHDFVEAPMMMSVARRRMQALMSAFGEAGIVDDGRWTTGWLRTDEIRRTRQWVYRNPNFNSHSRVRTASQAVKLVTDTQRARGTNERDAQVQQMENTLRLNRKRIQHLEDLVIVTTHQCHVYQEDLKLEEQRTSLLKRKFAEGCIGSMSNDELKAADSNCRAKISQIEEEIYRRKQTSKELVRTAATDGAEIANPRWNDVPIVANLYPSQMLKASQSYFHESSLMRVCVALCGRYGTGKDTIADILCKHYGFVNFKFARPLKNAIQSLFDMESDHVDGALKDVVHPKWGVTPRTLMQWFGTEVMQHGLNSIAPGTGRTFWSEQLRKELIDSDVQRVVISDLRFEHELQMLRDLYIDRLVTVRVVRNENTGNHEVHESETGVDKLVVDVEIANNGTLDELRTSLVSKGILTDLL